MAETDTKQPSSETRESSSAGTRPTKTDQWTPERLTGFWASMVGIYGRRWIEEYGADPHPVWVADLRSMTPAEAGIGWRACVKSGDKYVPTLPVFLERVRDGLREHKARNAMHKAIEQQPTSAETTEACRGLLRRSVVGASAAAGKVDVARLAKALGVPESHVEPRDTQRRSELRSELHPAGQFSLVALAKAKGMANRIGRSVRDLELELMAYNGWTPEDEERYDKKMEMCGWPLEHKAGDTPFLDAWRALG